MKRGKGGSVVMDGNGGAGGVAEGGGGGGIESGGIERSGRGRMGEKWRVSDG